MNELHQKFNLYDHLAYILVGFYQICIFWVLYILVFGGKFTSIFDFFKLEFSVASILGAYLVGHLVQAVSNIFEKWEKKKKEEKNKNFLFVMEKARTFFNLPENLPEKYVWQYCYLYSLSNDFSGHIALFNSMYSLYRGFWLASSLGFIGSISILVAQFVHYFVPQYTAYSAWRLLIFVCIMLVSSVLFSRRKKRFFYHTGEKTWITFDILSKNLLNKN